ncbi:MAG: RNA-binding S4 domain-containing protein [Oculatellaceae cyanobacterium Prado106]|jgi:ribosome-associated protein|nr:RNA-binding S4 domain-containing protein [Oculatellaceae cyanobacterium Prado106]
MTTDVEPIKLDQFLKKAGAVQTGGEAKLFIQNGDVKVNGKTETRRGRKLVEGDRITLLGQTFVVTEDPDSEPY